MELVLKMANSANVDMLFFSNGMLIISYSLSIFNGNSLVVETLNTILLFLCVCVRVLLA